MENDSVYDSPRPRSLLFSERDLERITTPEILQYMSELASEDESIRLRMEVDRILMLETLDLGPPSSPSQDS